MDLHSGAPYWLLKNGLTELSSPSSRRIDVAIVGAGITGALVATALLDAGRTVTLFDRHAPAEGSTAASTALLQSEIDRELTDLSERIGDRDAATAYRACAQAIPELERIAARFADVGFRRCDCLYLASTRRHVKRLRAEVAIRRANGLEAEEMSAADVAAEYGTPSHGAIRTRTAGVIDPVSLTRDLLRDAIHRGAAVVGRTRVDRVESANDKVVLTTDAGTYVANRVIFAMGYEVPSSLRPDLVQLRSSYALVTEPVSDLGAWSKEPVVWETARPYSYLRSTSDRRLLIGGMDLPFRDATRRDRHLPARRRRLELQLAKWIPSVPFVTAYAWAGTFAESSDGLPFIGPVPELPGAFAALGYGGNGILFSVIAASLLVDALRGAPNELLRLFRLTR